jgi:tRNA threonylcarbamoyladenosine biosynthesis protein TsaB
MRILALDSATHACSVAVWADGLVEAACSQSLARGQAEAIVPMIDAAMRAAGTGFDRIDRLAVTIGPGSFTGLRAGLATARGLALATGLPLIGITTLEALAAAVPAAEREGRRLVAALDSKRAEIYLQSFAADLARLDSPVASRPEAYAATIAPETRVVVAGDAAEAMREVLAARGCAVTLASSGPAPDPVVIAVLAATRPVPAIPPAPLYVHAAEARLPAGASRS